jgi:hypothetical protein
MLSSHITILCSIQCYRSILTLHFITHCNRPMLSPHVIIPCYCPMLSSHVIVPCYFLILSRHVIILCYHLMLLLRIIIPCYHSVLCSYVISQYIIIILCDTIIYFYYAWSLILSHIYSVINQLKQFLFHLFRLLKNSRMCECRIYLLIFCRKCTCSLEVIQSSTLLCKYLFIISEIMHGK